MARIAPVPRDECKDLPTVFEITEAVMGFLPTVCSLWRAIPSSWPPLPSFRPSLWPVRPMGESPTYCRSQRGQSAGELRSDSEPDLLNDAVFGAIYYRFLLHSGPLNRPFGEELVEQVIRGTSPEKPRG